MRRVSIVAFTVVALACAVGLAVAVSPWASADPDGLEKVAEDKGFLDTGKLHAIQDDSPIPDYAFPGIENDRLTTAVAGLVGTVIVFALAFGIGLVVRRRRWRDTLTEPAGT